MFSIFCLHLLHCLKTNRDQTRFSPKQQTVCLIYFIFFSALFLGWPFDCTVYNEGLLCLCKKNVSILPLWLLFSYTSINVIRFFLNKHSCQWKSTFMCVSMFCDPSLPLSVSLWPWQDNAFISPFIFHAICVSERTGQCTLACFYMRVHCGFHAFLFLCMCGCELTGLRKQCSRSLGCFPRSAGFKMAAQNSMHKAIKA